MKIISALITIVLLSSILSINVYLNNGIENTVDNIKANQVYYFYINATQYQIASFSLKASYMGNTSRPISYAYFYEYSDTSSSCLYSNYQTISSTITNNKFVSSFTYSINKYNTKYIAMKVAPSYDLDNITIKTDLNGGSYDLTNGVAKNLTDVKSGYSYYLFIPSSQFQIC
jgi:hypothetical protein